jgi:hypothetical protein
MANDRLFPAFVRVQYHSSKAPHVATLPLRELVSAGPGDIGEVRRWDNTLVASDTYIEDFIDLWATMVSSELTFDRWQLFSLEAPDAAPLWIWEAAHSAVGSAVIAAGLVFSVQHTISFRSDEGGLAKLTTMDRKSGGFFGRSYVPSAIEQTMIDFYESDLNAFAARDNGRPIAFLRLTVSQNDRLAREYHHSLS